MYQRRRGDWRGQALRRPPVPKQRRDGSRVWQTRHVAEHAEWVEIQAVTIHSELPHVLEHLWTFTASTIGTQGEVVVAGGRYAEDGSQNGNVPNLAIDWDDEHATDMKTVILGLARAGDVLEQTLRALGRLRVLDPERAKWLSEKTEPTAGAPCANCGRWVEGTPQDRIRGGRCEACAKYRSRNGAERPKHLWEEQVA